MEGPKNEAAGPKVDPVCGMTVPSGTPLRYTFGRDEYVFCSSECRDRFAENTARFVGAEASAAGVTYSCAKHPAVSASQPGSFPSCGVALEPTTRHPGD
jgi:P-type Cu+ transporter